MKQLTTIMALMLTLVVASCTRNGSNATNDDNFTTPLPPSGNYRVSYFFDDGQDKTSIFNGYTFSFENGGVFKAVGGGTTISGTWTETSSKLIIRLPVTTNPLKELDDDWLKEEKTPNSIKLKDDSKDERVHFTKL